jgi:N6-L-threonylcarbamoyladenine synthase
VILGIETSCDETCAAVIDGKLNVLSNIVSSQIDIHKEFGGVVPEIASRNHIENIMPVLDSALKNAGVGLSAISAVCATAEPGLPGAVMVGRTVGESLAAALNVPYVPVNHLCGHIAGLQLTNRIQPPFLCLLVSGGHTAIYTVNAAGGGFKAKLLLATADDAVGEAFDKVARVLGLPYPGGPKIAAEAKKYGGMDMLQFPVVKAGFSFSGLKTAVLNYINKERQAGRAPDIPRICAGFQTAAAEQLTARSVEYIKKYKVKNFGVCGGVSANEYLRERFRAKCDELGVNLFLPKPEFCGDNAAMIAAAGLLNYSV